MIFHNGRLVMGAGRTKVTVTLTANAVDYVFDPSKVPGYVAGETDATLVIDPGVVISASSPAGYALLISSAWATGDKVALINNGTIHGAGGAGGPTNNGNGINGSPGGTALSTQWPTDLTNNGIIGGGGGGGGSGCAIYGVLAGGQGGIGGTASPGTGGNGYAYLTTGTSGIGGTAGNPGGGGYNSGGETCGGGGGGGGWGAIGGAGGAVNGIGPSVGGPAGLAVNFSSNCNVIAAGTIYGAFG